MEAHAASVDFALREALEPYIQARIGSHTAETTGAGVFGVFEHDTARPVGGFAAPQVHSHVLIMNLAATSERTYALQPQEVYRAQTIAGAVYDAEVARRAIALGYELEQGTSSWEIKGYSREFIGEMSRRSEAINAYLKERGLSGPKAAEIAAHMTREAKDKNLTPDMMRRETLRIAGEYGIDPLAIMEQARRREHEVKHSPEASWKAAHAALTHARDSVFEREAVNDWRRIMASALNRAMGETGFDDVRRALDVRMRSREFVALEGKGMDRPMTTAKMLELEASNLSRMRLVQDTGSPLVHRRVEASLLTPEQQRAVKEILASTAGILALEARAGTGKTSRVLATVRMAAEADGYQVVGLGPTSRATKELRHAGIESMTLAKFLTQSPAVGSGKRLLILDEASLTSTRNMHELLNGMRPGDRSIISGGSRQHEAVEAGAPFRALQAAGIKTVRLEEILRQKDPALKHVVELLAGQNTREAVAELIRQGRVREIPNGKERMKAIAQEFARSPRGSVAVAPSNDERMELNRAIRSELQSTGAISKDERVVKVLTPRNELTGADRAWAGKYERGDVVRYSSGSRKLGIRSGDYARVVSVEARNNLLSVVISPGKVITYNPARLKGVSVFREVERAFAQGERIQLTAPFNARRIVNREFATLEKIDPSGNLQLKLDSGERLGFNLKEHASLDYGYAVTSHSVEGATAERALVLADTGQSKALLNGRMTYVSVSRAAHEVMIYTDSAADLAAKLSREHSKTMALDHTVAREKSVAWQNEMGMAV
jgi:hypothetical protein